MRNTRAVVLLIIGAILMSGLGACAATGQKPGTAIIGIFQADGMSPDFIPRDTIVPVGTTVIWSNEDKLPHTIVSDDGVFNKQVWPGTSFNFTFTERGTFAYHCDSYDMNGAVIVK